MRIEIKTVIYVNRTMFGAQKDLTSMEPVSVVFRTASTRQNIFNFFLYVEEELIWLIGLMTNRITGNLKKQS